MTSFVLSRAECSCSHVGDDSSCHYQVAWAINPHMQIGAADSTKACAQHAALVRALRCAGARVLRVPFLHAAYDSVFMKDSTILVERDGHAHALPTTFRHRERRIESAARAVHLARAGVMVAQPLSTALEGGDVHVIAHRRLALLGHGVRSDRASLPGLARFLGCDVVSLELRDPNFFHLDTALTVLSDDTLVYCRDAFTEASLRALEALRFHRIAEVSYDEAKRFSLNVVEVSETIITGTESSEMTALWRSLGRRVVTTPLDQFHLAGGSAACLVSRLHAVASPASRLAA
ncbi:arginine deiminase-related protein [soil metagenome]